jgi:SAM-dependent methyltransferase
MKSKEAISTAEFDSYADPFEELLAHSLKISMDKPEYFAAYKASCLTRMAPPDVERVLDHGFGIGMLSTKLKLQFPKAQADGFDPSPGSLVRLNPALLAQGSFEFDSNSLGSGCDLIVMANVLHHVKPVKRQSLISDVASRLAPGGRLVVFEYNPLNALMRWAVAQCVFDEDAILLPCRESILCFTRQGSKPTMIASSSFHGAFVRFAAFSGAFAGVHSEPNTPWLGTDPPTRRQTPAKGSPRHPAGNGIRQPSQRSQQNHHREHRARATFGLSR